MTRIALAVMAVLNVLCGSPGLAAGDESPLKGSVCVAPIPKPNGRDLSLGNPAGGGPSFDYSIQIGDGEIIDLPFTQNVQYKPLALEKKHLLKIRLGEKMAESFWFSFSDYDSAELCLWFKPLYATWSLWPQKNSSHLCQCSRKVRGRKN